MIGGLWSWISGEDDQTKAKPGGGLKKAAAAGAAVAAVAAAPTPDALAKPMPQAQSVSSKSVQQTNHNTITIQQQPGQDPRILAQQISKELNRQQRGALHD